MSQSDDYAVRYNMLLMLLAKYEAQDGNWDKAEVVWNDIVSFVVQQQHDSGGDITLNHKEYGKIIITQAHPYERIYTGTADVTDPETNPYSTKSYQFIGTLSGYASYGNIPAPGTPYPVCPECKGAGVIQLLNSTVPCKLCRPGP